MSNLNDYRSLDVEPGTARRRLAGMPHCGECERRQMARQRGESK